MLEPLLPPSNHGMRELNRSKFGVTVPLIMAQVPPSLISKMGKLAERGELLSLRGVDRIVAIDKTHKKKGVLFGRGIESPENLSEKLRSLLSGADVEYKPFNLELGYDHWTSEEVLESIFPRSEFGDTPSGFSVVGHIAHMNLREPFLEHKNLIGTVILDKNPSLRTVVNKLDTIDTKFRTFEMEVIAGVPDFEVEQHESNCRFQFDFRKVYWNSRLHSEHERLVKQFKPDEVVCDPMAGVGPFAVPAGKKGVLVLANDLNPESYKAMVHNVKLNKVEPLVRCYNEDGREFIRKSMQRLQELQAGGVQVPKKRKFGEAQEFSAKTVPNHISHFVMNLPATAIEFLDAFRGYYNGVPNGETLPLPSINVHCFHKWDPSGPEPTEEEIHAALAKRVSDALGYSMEASQMSFHDVRRVAPTKEMYCISFELPRQVALNAK